MVRRDAALTAIRELRYHNASSRVLLALRALERRYRADQPRAPAGQPDGGQWIAVGTSPRRRTAQGRVTFSGPLIKQNYDSATGTFQCTYYDAQHDYRFTVVVAADKCPDGYVRY